MKKQFEGQRVLVTGGSRGIGAAIVHKFAQQGANVAFTYASSPDKAKQVVEKTLEFGIKCVSIQADSADPKAVITAVDETVSKLGGIDILVNNAGIARMAPLDKLTLEDFDSIVAINIRAVFAAVQAASQHMKPGGRIINISSINAERVPLPGGSLYAMSKAALTGLVKGLARDLGPQGITINNVQPGPIETDMNPDNTASADLMKSYMAIPRYGSVDEIANMVLYLASKDAAYITGSSLTIDGGFSA